MGVLNRYIAIEIFKGTFVCAVVLVALVDFFTLADELRALGKGSYSLKKVFLYVALTSPRVFYDLFPSAALVGTMFSMGSMANNREIVAMRSAGISVFHIIWAVMRAGLVLVVIALIVGELIAPISERWAKEFKATAQNDQVASWSIYGFWTRDGNSFINIRQIYDRNSLGDISIYELDDNQQLESLSHADKAIYDGGKWVLDQREETEIRPDRVIVSKTDRSIWNSEIDPELLSVVVVRPDNLSVYGLAKYIQFLRDNGQQSEQFELALWGRIINPFVTLVMLLITVPFILNVSRTMSMGQRVMIGVVIGLGFILIDRLVGHIGLVYHLDPFAAAIIPGGVFFILALILTRRIY